MELQVQPGNELRNIDFGPAIESLQLRSKRCQRWVALIGGGLATSIFLIVFWIVWSYSLSNRTQQLIELRNVDLLLEKESNKFRASSVLDRPGATIDADADKFNQTPSSVGSASTANFPVIYGGLFSTVAFSIAAIGFVILVVQISVQFMRYYARLSELYAAQASALLASHGDTDLAIKFMDHFSPLAVDIGKTPATVYEKAFEVVAQALEASGKLPKKLKAI